MTVLLVRCPRFGACLCFLFLTRWFGQSCLHISQPTSQSVGQASRGRWAPTHANFVRCMHNAIVTVMKTELLSWHR